jgi:hypothetical protein
MKSKYLTYAIAIPLRTGRDEFQKTGSLKEGIMKAVLESRGNVARLKALKTHRAQKDGELFRFNMLMGEKHVSLQCQKTFLEDIGDRNMLAALLDAGKVHLDLRETVVKKLESYWKLP